MKIFISTLFCYLTLVSLIAFEGKQTLLKSIVTDQFGSPCDLELEFKAKSNGQKTKVKTNITTGKFEQLLTTNEVYSMTVISPNYVREDIEVIIPDHKDAYSEYSKNFNVKKIVQGALLKELNLFNGNQISDEGKKEIDKLKLVLNFNRAIELITLQVNSKPQQEELQKHIESLGAYKVKFKVEISGSGNTKAIIGALKAK
jgi:hypothetical protein